MLCILFILLMCAGYTYFYNTLTPSPLYDYWVICGILSGLVSFALIFLFILLPFFALTKPTNAIKHFLAIRLTNFILIISRIRVKVENKDLIASKDIKPLVFVSNHKSQLDPFFIYRYLKRPITVLSKAELRKITILRWILDAFGIIPINRESDRAAAVSIAKAIKVNQAGVPFIFFPEGGIKTRDVEQCVALRPGVYKLPLKSQATIQPIAIFGASKIAKRKWYTINTVTVKFLPAISYDEYKNLNTHEIGNLFNNIINAEFANEQKVELVVEN